MWYSKKFKHNNKEYNWLYCDTYDLLKWVKEYSKYEKSLMKLMTDQRDRDFKIIDFVIEDYEQINRGKRNYYFFIFNDKELIAISRITIDNKHGSISAVHTNTKFRNQGFCKKILNKLMKESKSKHKIRTFQIGVDTNNIPAIKCYTNVGFKIKKSIKDKFGAYHDMYMSL